MSSLDVLAFAPHPDDAEIFCGGFLAAMAARGYRVGIIDLVAGELGSQGTVEERARESAAATALGLALRENLGFPDGAVSAGDPFDPGSQLTRTVHAIRRLRPALVLAPYEHDRHPDHGATSRLVTNAAYYAALRRYPGSEPAFQTAQLLYYQLRTDFRPSFVVDVSAVYDKKLESIRVYRSQIERAKDYPEDAPKPLVSSPLVVSSIEARDGRYGAMIGVRYAEPFLTRTVVGIEDPVQHYRGSAASGALIFPEYL